MARILLVTGGCRSGKSAYAQRRAMAVPGQRAYVATCPVVDEETARRIAAHRRAREGQGWLTIEEPTDLEGVLRRHAAMDVLLVDCLTLWINNLLYEAGRAGRPLDEPPCGAMLQAATGLTPGTSVVVRPAYMTLSLMFYRPDLRFPGVLDPQKALAPETRALLPSWVYCCAEPPDVLLVGHGSVGPNEELPTGGHEYAMANVLKLFWFDRTRPELPWHSFRYDDADDQRLGILVFKRKD